ncbi:hypothetical protein G9A89_014291 [Geosiphon pyriformis]|nr:hypothetical protein G9A89_014291 [Geosiphon pyriformis]
MLPKVIVFALLIVLYLGVVDAFQAIGYQERDFSGKATTINVIPQCRNTPAKGWKSLRNLAPVKPCYRVWLEPNCLGKSRDYCGSNSRFAFTVRSIKET